jgi:hypothetical protein
MEGDLKIYLDDCSRWKGNGWHGGPTLGGRDGGCGLSVVAADFSGFVGGGVGGGLAEDWWRSAGGLRKSKGAAGMSIRCVCD